MPPSRPVVSSDGEAYPSLTEAAKSAWVKPGSLHAAVQATRCGLMRTSGGLQWAYADEVPEVWPEKRIRKRKEGPPKAVKLVLDPLDESLIRAPEYTETEWRPVLDNPDFEVSSQRSVRQVNADSLMSRSERRGVSLVRIRDRVYSIVELMMLAFVGPKPFGYVIRRLEGESEVLSNLCYAPRKLRKKDSK